MHTAVSQVTIVTYMLPPNLVGIKNGRSRERPFMSTDHKQAKDLLTANFGSLGFHEVWADA